MCEHSSRLQRHRWTFGLGRLPEPRGDSKPKCSTQRTSVEPFCAEWPGKLGLPGWARRLETRASECIQMLDREADMTSGVDWKLLRDKAIEVSGSAYAPYSRFPVGAAALVDDGRI